MSDVLPIEFLTSHEPTAMNIKYEHEVLYGNKINQKSNLLIMSTKHRIWFGDVLSLKPTIEWTTASN